MYKPLQRKAFIFLVFLASCSPAEPPFTPIPTPSSVTFETSIPVRDDEELAEAVRQAQETLHIWRQEFLAPKKSYSMTSLKSVLGKKATLKICGRSHFIF